MKIINPGNPEVSYPHRCEASLWRLEDSGRVNMGTIVECECGAQWRAQSRPGLRGYFGEFHSARSNAYWVRIKKGK